MKNYNEYLLMNKDIEVIKFISDINEYNEVILEQVSENESTLPIAFEDIHSFISNRQAPKHRAHIQELLVQSGCNNLEGFLNVSHALSLNDTYWVKSADSDLKWKDVSLYHNDFDEVVAQLAFEGGNSKIEFSSTSPEYVTDGTYAKCWVRENDEIYLLKTGFHKDGLEPFSEYYASQIAEIISHKYVKYSIGMHHNKLVSKCRLFTSEEDGYVSAIKVLEEKGHNKISYLINTFADLGFEEDFRRMVILDALIVNIDRHAGNYGFIVNNETQEIKCMAPVFDHNRSLLYSLESEKLDNVEDYMRLQLPRIGGDFNTAANILLTPEIRSDLLNLKYFTFKRDANINLPEKRLKVIERVISNQIDNILNARSMCFYKHKTIQEEP